MVRIEFPANPADAIYGTDTGNAPVVLRLIRGEVTDHILCIAGIDRQAAVRITDQLRFIQRCRARNADGFQLAVSAECDFQFFLTIVHIFQFARNDHRL